VTETQKEYRRFLQSADWQEKKAVMNFMADYRCERCGSPIKLDTHHVRYPKRGTETPYDLRVLCRVCHRKEHKT